MTKKFSMIVVLMALYVVGTALVAQAALFNFSYVYDSSGSIIAGMLEGDIQSDMDTVIVSSVTMASINGAPIPTIRVDSAIELIQGGPDLTPQVSISGNVMDLLTCDDILFCNLGIAFANPPIPGFGGAFDFLMNTDSTFVTANWLLAEKNPVPAPSAMLLFGSGLAGLFGWRYRHTTKK